MKNEDGGEWNTDFPLFLEMAHPGFNGGAHLYWQHCTKHNCIRNYTQEEEYADFV